MEHVACNLCGVDNAAPHCKVGQFQVVRCNECGLFYTNPRRSAHESAKVYSEKYFMSDNPSTLGYEDYSVHAEGLKQVFADNLSIIETCVRPPASIIDVGCAFGYFVQLASSRGWKAEGVEISEFAAQVAREKTGATIYTGALADARLHSRSYDAATMWDMLEHSCDPAGELEEVGRILKPGGYLFMTIPDAGSLPARLMGSRWYGFKSAAEHNFFFSKETLGRMLSRKGFGLVEFRRGVWPCSMKFMSSKLAPYSPAAARLTDKLVRRLGMEGAIVKFKFIDMFVIAKKNDNPSRESSRP